MSPRALTPLPAPKSRQEAFDGVWQRIKAQGRPSVSPAGRCLYRGADGAACAIGHFLDEPAALRANGLFFLRELADHSMLPGLLAEDPGFSKAIQDAHDYAAEDFPDGGDGFLEAFEQRMEEVAVKFGLVAPSAPVPS